MPTPNQSVWALIQTNLDAIAGIAKVSIGEPHSLIATQVCAAIIPQGGRFDGTTLSYPRELHSVIIRIYSALMDDKTDLTEIALDNALNTILADVWGDFTLGGNIAYAEPTETAWEYDYEEVGAGNEGSIVYRTLSVSITYRIDDRFAFAP